MNRPPLTLGQLVSRLDVALEVEFSFLKTERIAPSIATRSRVEQEFLLDWTGRVASINVQLAYAFISEAVAALDRMERSTIEEWGLHAMDTYDRSGLKAALDVVRAADHFVQRSHERKVGAVFGDVSGILLRFVHGLSGRALRLETGDAGFTDTETIFLPPAMTVLPSSQENFLAYKSMVAFLWAQTRYGTFGTPFWDALAASAHPETLLQAFGAFEAVRLEALIARELPGLFRDMTHLRSVLGQAEPETWRQWTWSLRMPGAGVDASLAMARAHAAGNALPAAVCFQGILRPDQVRQVMRARIEREKARFRNVLRELLDNLAGEADGLRMEEGRFGLRAEVGGDEPDPDALQLTFDGAPVPVPEHARALARSIVQDLGTLPDDYLVPAGPGEYDPALFHGNPPDPDEVWQGVYHEIGASLVDEWDYRRQHYRKQWCAVREKSVPPVWDDFCANTLIKYGPLVGQLRRAFEAMRDEERLLKRQAEGDDIDLEALVQALADSHDGAEMSDRVLTRLHRTERNIAVVFMVDMSGSTKGWINDAERESLLLLAEALEALGDRYAIYGFSGMARKRCEIYRIKGFADAYDEEVRARISGIRPQDYTRMGFAIRHLTRILNGVEARTRVLITISDGKPDDYDGYRGTYGIEDTRRALLEARRDGIHPYCITIDREARDYLPRLYGAAGYTVVDDVARLPFKVSDVYRRLTT